MPCPRTMTRRQYATRFAPATDTLAKVTALVAPQWFIAVAGSLA